MPRRAIRNGHACGGCRMYAELLRHAALLPSMPVSLLHLHGRCAKSGRCPAGPLLPTPCRVSSEPHYRQMREASVSCCQMDLRFLLARSSCQVRRRGSGISCACWGGRGRGQSGCPCTHKRTTHELLPAVGKKERCGVCMCACGPAHSPMEPQGDSQEVFERAGFDAAPGYASTHAVVTLMG